jgi:hypothetical protein
MLIINLIGLGVVMTGVAYAMYLLQCYINTRWPDDW